MARADRLAAATKSYKRTKKPSIARTGKIATLDKTLIKGLLGRLTQKELTDLNGKLKAFLQLP